ncbi:MAG TPA: 50S ribosomal protein L22 [Acidimicrobiia bacterium]|nr:50S ribosomal protein L22 [Acidimicrobiia bacterium]
MADTATKETPQTRATLKYLRTSAYKVREVLDLIRGLDVDDARHVLQFSERGPAREVLKVLNSAVANADNLLNIPADELKVSLAYADEGPTIKRWRPRARGRATRIRKRTCHVTVVVARLSDDELQARRRRDSAAGTQRRRGVLPRRRRAAEEAPKAGKGKAKAAAPAAPAPEEEVAEEQLPEEPSVAEVEPGPAAEEPAAEEPAAEEPAAEEPAAEGEGEAPAAETETPPEEEEGK